MELKMFSIRDSKAEVYNQPHFCLQVGEAERNLMRLVRDPQSMISQFPEDYDLYLVGLWNDKTGVMESLATPQHIAKAVALKER